MKYGSLIHIQRSLNFSGTKFLSNFPNNSPSSLPLLLSFSITSLLTVKSASTRSLSSRKFTFIIIEIIRRIKHYYSRETDRTKLNPPNDNQKRSQSLKPPPLEERFFFSPPEYLGRRAFNQRSHLTQSHFPPFFAALVPSANPSLFVVVLAILCYTRAEIARAGREKSEERERKRGWHCPTTLVDAIYPILFS